MTISKELVGAISLCAAMSGFGLSAVIINSENGYVGGMIFVPLFLLVIIAAIVLFIAGVIGFSLDRKSWGWGLLLSSFLLPASFIASCLVAKYFEIGAYRIQPMIPLSVS